MAWVPIRKTTEEDWRKLEDKAKAFMERHGLSLDDPYDSYQDTLDAFALAPIGEGEEQEQERLILYRLWLRVLRRTLKEPQADGIAYGFVGFWQE
jgi:hypothetical protein